MNVEGHQPVDQPISYLQQMISAEAQGVPIDWKQVAIRINNNAANDVQQANQVIQQQAQEIAGLKQQLVEPEMCDEA